MEDHGTCAPLRTFTRPSDARSNAGQTERTMLLGRYSLCSRGTIPTGTEEVETILREMERVSLLLLSGAYGEFDW